MRRLDTGIHLSETFEYSSESVWENIRWRGAFPQQRLPRYSDQLHHRIGQCSTSCQANEALASALPGMEASRGPTTQ